MHFIRPEWLLALLPLALTLWFFLRQHQTYSAWNRYIAPHLAKVLLTKGNKKSIYPLYLLAFSWLIATLALAGPAINKQSLPVFAAEQGRVLVMDMSVSMFATDLSPNRLTQAKFKATDLLRNLKEGETGLIAYAGEAFTISPLTRDTGTLLNLLPTLSPEIMPVLGSNLAAALTQAKNLLIQGGHIQGDIILVTDGISSTQFDQVNSVLNGTEYRLAIIAFGTSEGAPIRLPDGQLQRDSSNEVVVAKTDFKLLHKLARSNKGVLIKYNTYGEDLNQLQQWLSDTRDTKATDLGGETWQDLGPYLALLLLLPALFSFRQGIAAGFAILTCGILLTPSNAHASVWKDLWNTTDQQAMQAYQSQDYANAAKQFESSQWRGTAQYKAGDYGQALKTFEQDHSAQGLYNQGNALMQLGQPDKAKERYQAALEKQPGFPEAKANLELAERLLKEQQQDQQNKEQGQQDDKQSGEQQSGEQQSGEQQSGEQQSGEQQSGEQQSGEQQSGEQQSGEQQPGEQQSGEQQSGEQQSGEQQSGEQQSGEQQSGEQQSGEQQSGEQQSGEQQSSGQEQQSKQDDNDQYDNQNDLDKSQQDEKNEPVSNEAKMQAQTGANTEEQSANQKKQSISGNQSQEQNKQDKQDVVIGDSIEAPPSNSDPLPAQMQRALRGVSEDPQVLLRNKMQLEYQIRRQKGQISRDNEQW